MFCGLYLNHYQLQKRFTYSCIKIHGIAYRLPIIKVSQMDQKEKKSNSVMITTTVKIIKPKWWRLLYSIRTDFLIAVGEWGTKKGNSWKKDMWVTSEKWKICAIKWVHAHLCAPMLLRHGHFSYIWFYFALQGQKNLRLSICPIIFFTFCAVCLSHPHFSFCICTLSTSVPAHFNSPHYLHKFLFLALFKVTVC